MKNFNSDNFTGKNHEGKHANTPLRFLTASSIMSNRVFNFERENLGGVKDIMIDVVEGKIEYVIVEFGGFLGIDEKFFAIPFGLLEIDEEKEAFILNQDKETLENAPGFDKDHWPETNSHYMNDVGTYWGGFMGPNTGAMPY